MIHASVIPNRQIIHVLPLMSDLQVMVFDNQLHKPIQCLLTLFFRQSIDVLHMVPDSKDGLPSSNGVRADHGMDGRKRVANVLGRTARLGI